MNLTDSIPYLTEKSFYDQLKKFIEFFPSPVLILDEKFTVNSANNNSFQLIGDPEYLIGRHISELMTSDNADEIIHLLKESFASAETHTIETRIKTSDNRLFESIATFKSFVDADTNKKFCVYAMFDFTQQKMREEILKKSEYRFKEMANNAPVMIWIADIDGLFSFVNKVWLENSGGELGSQLGMNWLNQVHPEDFKILLENYQDAVRAKKPFSVEFRFKNKNNKYEWLLIKGKPRFSQENFYMGFIGSCIIIQEQKEIENKISTLNEELIQTVSSRDKFFSIISHDLRSPMSGLMGILDLLNSSYETMEEEEIKEIISDATVVSKTTYTLLENLLDWSRIQNKTIFYNPENLKIHRLIENISILYAQNIKNKYITVYNDTSPDQFIFADKSMTETILRNLFSNAIKFSYKGGFIRINSKVENEMLVVQVTDSGVGIDEEKLSGLLKSNISLSSKGTEKESGTGLGLIICKELVEKQSGKIWVESKKNEGSTFYFSVPLAR
jgi:PAS domain S-box-containing protein